VSISFHDIITEIKPRKNVRIIITRLSPSRARCRLIPKAGIQSSLISAIHSLSVDVRWRTNIRMIIKSTNNAEREIMRGQTGFLVPVNHAKNAPASNIAIR
jgi:hypothetical protein